jgi:hypothetical protein
MYSRLDSPIFKIRVLISLCGALFLGCYGMYELVKAAPLMIQLGQFQRNSVPVEATTHSGDDNGYRYTIRFNYVASGMQLGGFEDVSEAFYKQYRYSNLTVYYDRTQPSVAHIDLNNLYSLRRGEVLFGGGAMIFCVLMFTFWYWMYFGRG